MELTLRVAEPEDVEAFFTVDGRAFGVDYTEQERAELTAVFEVPRFRLVCDGDEVVGVSGAYSFETTMPGGAPLPVGGITWITVAATHRRRGILTRMMAALHEDLAARGEPLALLGASEGGIYERFGYGVCTSHWCTAIGRREARFRKELPEAQRVRYASSEAARPAVEALWERYRRKRPCELSRSTAWWDRLFAARARPRGGETSGYYLLHPDGYACYRLKNEWNLGLPAHEVHVVELVALTPEAHLALWKALLELDLTGEVEVFSTQPDEALPFLLENPRLFRTQALGDGLWGKVLDPARCFGARTYGTDDRLVLECEGKRFLVEGGPEGGRCAPTTLDADLVLAPSALGPLLFGVPATTLVRGRRAQARSYAAQRRADHFFSCDPAPHCQTFF